MGCESFEVELSALASGSLDEEATRRVETHAAGCPSCARELSELRALVGALEPAVAVRSDRSLAAETWARYSARHERSLPRSAALLAVAAALVFFGVWTLQLGSTDDARIDGLAALEQELDAEEAALSELARGLELDPETAAAEDTDLIEDELEDVELTEENEG